MTTARIIRKTRKRLRRKPAILRRRKVSGRKTSAIPKKKRRYVRGRARRSPVKRRKPKKAAGFNHNQTIPQEGMALHVMEEQGVPAPKDYYRSTWDWIRAQPSPPNYHVFYGDQTTGLKPPKGVDGPMHISFEWTSFYSPAPYVAELPNGRVWGNFGTVITPDNKLLWDVSIFPPFVPERHPVFEQSMLPSIMHTDETVAVLTFCAGSMYYHWMFDILARIDLLRKSGIAIDRYIVNNVRSAFQWETLQLMGIPAEKVILCHGTFHLEAQRLIVPVAPAIEWGPHHWQVQFLREELLAKSAGNSNAAYERIYISRSLAAHRKVTNEDQILELLQPLGFTCVHLEHYTVAQQAEILSSAKVIVAPHGSGLTNLIFCERGTKVIELFPSNFPVNVNWVTSNHRDLDYYYVFEDGERSADKIASEHGYKDMTIGLAKLSQVLALAGIG